MEHNVRKELEQAVRMGRALDALSTNSAFQTLIIEGFLHDYRLQAAKEFSHTVTKGTTGTESPSSKLDSVGCVEDYLFRIKDNAIKAQKDLDTLNDTM